MTWIILIAIVILLFVFLGRNKNTGSGSIKLKPNTKEIKEESNRSDYAKLTFLHPEIVKFVEIVNDKSKTIELSIQNDYVKYLIDTKGFDNSVKYQNRTKEAVKQFENEIGIESDTAITLFVSDHVDGEGPNLLTDKSGKIYRYHYAEPTLCIISGSIWELISQEELMSGLEQDQGNVYFDKISYLTDHIELERVTKFGIHGFYMEDYKQQLENVFLQSDGSLTLNSFEWEEFDWNSTEQIVVKLKINDSSEIISIENSKWYDFRFPGVINKLLSSLNSEYRMSLVHENSWDETHGILLTKIEEHEMLNRNRLIIG